MATVDGAAICASLPADSRLAPSPVAHTAGHLSHASTWQSMVSPQLLSASCQMIELFLAAVAVISKKPVICPVLLYRLERKSSSQCSSSCGVAAWTRRALAALAAAGAGSSNCTSLCCSSRGSQTTMCKHQRSCTTLAPLAAQTLGPCCRWQRPWTGEAWLRCCPRPLLAWHGAATSRTPGAWPTCCPASAAQVRLLPALKLPGPSCMAASAAMHFLVTLQQSSQQILYHADPSVLSSSSDHQLSCSAVPEEHNVC